ncbi:MAG: DUF92 domain-containing protein [Candidatus Ornithospirochaeta sp.]
MQTLTGRLDRYLTLLPLWALLLIYLAVLSLIALFAYKKKWLTLSGAASAIVLGLIVLWMGGVSAFIIFLFFFVSSSLVSKVSKFVNRSEKKGNQRDIVQVLANGLPAVLAIMLIRVPSLYLASLAAFSAANAEAAADTWSGSFGVMSKKDPVSIITFTKVPKGISGGVTALGFLGGFSASLLVAVLSIGVFGHSIGIACIIAGSGFLGSVIDSVLGAVVQVQYRAKDGSLTEKDEENGEKNERVRGIPGFDNDAVNFTSGILAASLAMLLTSLVS